MKYSNKTPLDVKLIVPQDFYSDDTEKTKLNWFCYEFALELELFIKRKLRTKLQRENIDDRKIADFCIHYSKHMKGPILRRVSGLDKDLHITYHEIERFFPSFLSDHLVDELLTVVAEAWNSQTEACVHCPTRCISERDNRAPMFDDPFYLD